MTAAAAMLLVVGTLTACSTTADTDDAVPPAPTATKHFATPTPVGNGTTIAAGAWGVVTYHNSSNGDQTFALRVTHVTRGKAGAFDGIESLGGGDLTPKSATPWWIDYDWVTIAGTATWSPNHQVSAVAADTDDQAALETLSVPDAYIHCDRPETDTSFGKLDVIQHGCLTAASSSSVRPSAIFFSSAGGTEDVRWALH